MHWGASGESDKSVIYKNDNNKNKNRFISKALLYVRHVYSMLGGAGPG